MWASGGPHRPHCAPCLGWARILGCEERASVLASRPVEMPQMGKESPTVQAMGEGRVPPGKELERQRAGGVWEEIEGILHFVSRVVRRG